MFRIKKEKEINMSYSLGVPCGPCIKMINAPIVTVLQVPLMASIKCLSVLDISDQAASLCHVVI